MGTPERGVDWYLSVNTGTIAVPVWTRVGGQRNSPFDRTTDEIDTTDKESSGLKSNLAGLRGWSISCDLLCQTDDAGWQELESVWETDQQQAHLQLTRADATTYSGLATMTSFSIDEAHDGAVMCSCSFTGNGVLTKA